LRKAKQILELQLLCKLQDARGTWRSLSARTILLR